jgi:WD40 repeat protein
MPDSTIKLEAERALSHNNAVYWAAFSNDGRQLATASLDNTVKLWNVADGTPVGTLKGHGDGVAFVGYLKDGRLVTASLDKTLKVWSPEGALKATLAGHADYLSCAAVPRSGTLCASGGFDKTVRVWDADAGGAVAVLTGHEAAVQAVTFSADAATIVSGGNDRSVRLWDIAAKKGGAVLTGHNAVVEAVSCSPKDELIASGDAEGRIRLWKQNGESVANFESRSPRIRSLAFSPDGRWLAAGGADGMVRLISAGDQREIAAVSAHKNTTYGVAFSPDGKLLASAGFDRTIRLWRIGVA